MSVSPSDLASRPGPRYRALADCLEASIRSAALQPGDRLPPQRDLAYDLSVTVGTVGRAYGLLLQRGLVRGEVGRGTYVLEPGDRPAMPAPLAAPTPAHDLAVNRPVAVPAQSEVFRILGEIASEATGLTPLLTYPPYSGHEAHRRALADWLAGFAGPVEPARILPCQGTQNGMAAALAAVTRPGDSLLVEALSYASNQGLAMRLGLKLLPVTADAEGALPESIEMLCRAHRPTAIVLSPDVQNPTLATASVARREAIIALARRHDLAIIEDAVYAPVAATGLPSFLALAAERTLLVTSTSKFLAPGLRIGCVAAPPGRMAALIGAQAHLAVGVSPLIAETFARLQRQGVLAEALGQQRAALVRRREVALRVLNGFTVSSRENALHVLLDLPEGLEVAGTVLRLANVGIHTTPLSVFAVGRTPVSPTLRLSLGAEPDEASLERCLITLRNHLGEQTPNHPVI
jgi:DNA-binding transcriptional MocR family regulator